MQLCAADGRMFSAGAGAVLCAWPVLLNAAQHLQATAGSVVLTYTLPATKLMVLTPPNFDVALSFFGPRMVQPYSPSSMDAPCATAHSYRVAVLLLPV